MALLTVGSTHLCYREVVVLIHEVESFLVVVIRGIYILIAVAIDAPAHFQLSVLVDDLHVLHITVAGFAFHVPCFDVLRVIEVNVIR